MTPNYNAIRDKQDSEATCLSQLTWQFRSISIEDIGSCSPTVHRTVMSCLCRSNNPAQSRDYMILIKHKILSSQGQDIVAAVMQMPTWMLRTAVSRAAACLLASTTRATRVVQVTLHADRGVASLSVIWKISSHHHAGEHGCR